MPPKPAQRREFVHPSASHAKKKAPASPYAIQPITAFYLFLIANFVAASFAPIQDCDETFNYWEPTHYLSHGYGLQTWEYSPTYAIRSWTYIGIHAIIGNLRRLLPRSNKVAEFYFVRYALAGFCAFCQANLFTVISSTLHPRVGLFFVLATISSPGNFHASAAYLPSSFAMYMGMLALACFLDWRGGVRTSMGMFWSAMGGILGWPFAAALCLPFIAEEAFLGLFSMGEGLQHAVVRGIRGAMSAVVIVFLDAAFNTFFYRKIEIVPWNIVKYNVLSKSGGPNLYGTEPWTYYFRNLALNYNLWFALSLVSFPVFILHKLLSRSQHGFQSGLRTIVFLAPFYMWLAIFTLQPHKEERFMYPAYPFLALNAAIALHIILVAFGNPDPKTLVGRVPAKLKLSIVSAGLLTAFILGSLRILGITTAYSAPLSLYTPLGAGQASEAGTVGGAGDFVCYGKEWYRFPTSYFLPRGMHAKWVRSEFRGLLPGEFSEARTGFGVWSGTWLPPLGMNDMNVEDLGKYVDLRACQFLVDTQYPEQQRAVELEGGKWTPPPNEPDYVADEANWEVVKCERFLDAASTSFLARTLWIPDLPYLQVPETFKRKWGRHCLLKRR